MPRRLALALLVLPLLLLLALLAGRKLKTPPPAGAVLALRPTPVIPPTPIPARRVSLYFESSADDSLHPEARDVPAALDDVAFLRSVAAAVLDGPRRPELVKPFPEGWSLRGAYLLHEGLAVVDLSPPSLPEPRELGAPAGPRWQAGAHEEDTAIQAIAVSVARNLPTVTRIVLLVAGEPAETLGGHSDLMHPIAPDLKRAAEEPPLDPGPLGTPAPSASPLPAPSPDAQTATPSPLSPVPARRAPGERT